MDFLNTLRQRQVRFRPAGKRGEIWMCCLFCVLRGEPSPDTKYRLGVNFITGIGHCFRCDWRSPQAPNHILSHILGQKVEAENFQVPDEQEEQEEEKPELPEDFQLLSKVKPSDDELSVSAKSYMVCRGFDRQMLAHYRIGVSLSGRYAYRIIFPVMWGEKLKGIVARDFTGSAQVKYLNSKGKKYLYNLPHKQCDQVILSEGCFKAIAIERALGHPSAALLGHRITETQIKQLRYVRAKRVVIWPDPDIAGQKGAMEVASTLCDIGIATKVIWPPPLKQADELSSRSIWACWRERTPYTWNIHKRLEAQAAFS